MVSGTGPEILIGAILPIVVDLINRYIKHSRLRYLISLLIPVLVGAGMNYGALQAGDPGELLGSMALVFAAAQTTYKVYWNKSKYRSLVVPQETLNAR